MERLIILMIGILLGMAIYAYAHKTTPVGILRVHRSYPENYLSLEFKKPVGEFYNKKYVTFEVSQENHISQD